MVRRGGHVALSPHRNRELVVEICDVHRPSASAGQARRCLCVCVLVYNSFVAHTKKI